MLASVVGASVPPRSGTPKAEPAVLLEDRGSVLTVRLDDGQECVLLLDSDDHREAVAMAIAAKLTTTAPPFRVLRLLGGEAFLQGTRTQSRLFPLRAKAESKGAVLVLREAASTLPVGDAVASKDPKAHEVLVARYLTGREDVALARRTGSGEPFDPPRRDAFALNRKAQKAQLKRVEWFLAATPNIRVALTELDAVALGRLTDTFGNKITVTPALSAAIAERKQDLLQGSP